MNDIITLPNDDEVIENQQFSIIHVYKRSYIKLNNAKSTNLA